VYPSGTRTRTVGGVVIVAAVDGVRVALRVRMDRSAMHAQRVQESSVAAANAAHLAALYARASDEAELRGRGAGVDSVGIIGSVEGARVDGVGVRPHVRGRVEDRRAGLCQYAAAVGSTGAHGWQSAAPDGLQLRSHTEPSWSNPWGCGPWRQMAGATGAACAQAASAPRRALTHLS